MNYHNNILPCCRVVINLSCIYFDLFMGGYWLMYPHLYLTLLRFCVLVIIK